MEVEESEIMRTDLIEMEYIARDQIFLINDTSFWTRDVTINVTAFERNTCGS